MPFRPAFPGGGGYLTAEVTGMYGKSLHTLYLSHEKCPQKYTMSHKNCAKSINYSLFHLKHVLPHDTLSHNFLINCNTLTLNFYQKRTPCPIIFTAKGHPVEWHIPSCQVWESPMPLGTGMSAFSFLFITFYHLDTAKLLWHCGGRIVHAW